MIVADTTFSVGDLSALVEEGLPQPNPLTWYHATSLGPIALSDGSQNLNARFWHINQVNGEVFIYGAEGVSWGAGVKLFDEPVAIVSMDLTFDQNGRPIVFYTLDNVDIKIHFYDSNLGRVDTRVFTQGAYPLAAFDVPQNASSAISDACLFYVRDNTAYMRVQRDRFEIEHNLGITHPGLILLSAGLNKNNAFQINYEYDAD
ncbi:hypothetical protein K6Y31_20665 [Motilimonas cestriensis]|uniref:Uncharacterized protein n=1 Tax=Motilimonas cestriensis TaxID=2742685 RepID=A0ABS8WFB8_9GAMM|nr:hypothetical protein [Motilimonas cestriensis]MCE2597190.1 hypothetical protein [Motilimonas cestriensis]